MEETSGRATEQGSRAMQQMLWTDSKDQDDNIINTYEEYNSGATATQPSLCHEQTNKHCYIFIPKSTLSFHFSMKVHTSWPNFVSNHSFKFKFDFVGSTVDLINAYIVLFKTTSCIWNKSPWLNSWQLLFFFSI